MSWIREVTPELAEGRLKDIYAELRAKRGRIANILQVHSLRPEALAAHLTLYMDLLFAPGDLSRKQREMIAVVVSRANNCDYCIAHHAEALSKYMRDPQLLLQFTADYRSCNLPAADLALMDYAVELTLAPGATRRDGLDRLRQLGFSDEQILLANLITAYFNFVNRIALGLGVEATPEEISGYRV